MSLHLCTFKTPTCRRFMSAKVGSLCAFKMRKGVIKLCIALHSRQVFMKGGFIGAEATLNP